MLLFLNLSLGLQFKFIRLKLLRFARVSQIGLFVIYNQIWSSRDRQVYQIQTSIVKKSCLHHSTKYHHFIHNTSTHNSICLFTLNISFLVYKIANKASWPAFIILKDSTVVYQANLEGKEVYSFYYSCSA